MAEDPWAQYRSGAAPVTAVPASPAPPAPTVSAPSANPWAAYKSGAPPPSPTATSAPISPAAPGGAGQGPASSFDPNWKPSGNALWDLMTRPIAKTEDPLSAARDYGLSALDAATFGYGPAKLGLESQTAQAHANLGLMDPLAQGVGYAVGPGKILGPVARGLTGGGVLAAGAEGAGAGALGAYGHGEDPTTGALMGGGLGLAGGVGSKVLNSVAGKLGVPGTPSNAADITQNLQDAKTAAYGQLKNTFYNPNDVTTALQNAGHEITLNDPGGGLQRNAPRSMAELTKMYNQAATSSTQTAHDIYTSIQNLDKPQGALGGAENDVAPIVQKHLQNVLDNVPPVSTTQTGPAADLAAAKLANQQWANARDLQQASQSLKGFGSSPSGWAQATAEKFYPDPNSAQYKVLSDIANAAGGANAGQSAYGIVHGVVHPLVEAAAFHTLPPGIAPLAAAGATFLGAKPAIGAALGARSKAAAQNAIGAAYPTLTGQQFTPPKPADVGQALRALLFGQAAGNFQ